MQPPTFAFKASKHFEFELTLTLTTDISSSYRLSPSLPLCVCKRKLRSLSSLMAAQVLLVLMLAMVGRSYAAWCVCKPEMGNSALQKTIDYACGAGADCTPILQNGACYNPNTVIAHCNYAANSYYQRKGQAQGTCDFSGAATLTTTDPSSSGCSYPSSASAAAGSSTSGAFSPPNSALGLGPSSSSMFDSSNSGFLQAGMVPVILAAILSLKAMLN